jgi:hypothetical protein
MTTLAAQIPPIIPPSIWEETWNKLKVWGRWLAVKILAPLQSKFSVVNKTEKSQNGLGKNK